MNIGEELQEMGLNDVVYFPDFDDECIIGIDTNGRTIYNYEKMVNFLIEEGMDDIEAIEWLEYNTIRSLPYIDSQTNGKAPIIMYSCAWLGF